MHENILTFIILFCENLSSVKIVSSVTPPHIQGNLDNSVIKLIFPNNTYLI